MIKPKIELYVSGKIYTGWKSTETYLDLESLSHYTSLECAYTEKDDVTIRNGEKCELKIDNELVLTGYIDRLENSITGDSFNLHIEIRSKTADLVDCSAGYQQIQNRDAKSIAEELCKPFDITVVWDTEQEPRKITWKIEPMDTVFDVLRMIARECNLILTTNNKGEVVFTEAGTKNVGTLVLGKDLLSFKYTDDWTARFSDYICCGDNQSYRDDWIGGSQSVVKKGNVKTTVKDEEINRYRPILMMTDDVASGQNTRAMAEFERNRSISMGKVMTVRIRGWRNNDTLWQINECLDVAVPIIFATDWLITAVTLILNEDDGYVSELTLSPPEGFGSQMYGDRYQDEKPKKGAGKPDWEPRP